MIQCIHNAHMYISNKNLHGLNDLSILMDFIVFISYLFLFLIYLIMHSFVYL